MLNVYIINLFGRGMLHRGYMIVAAANERQATATAAAGLELDGNADLIQGSEEPDKLPLTEYSGRPAVLRFTIVDN